MLVVEVGNHTPGFQFVILKNSDGIWIMASDVTPLWANFERMKASGQSSNKELAKELMLMMLELVDGNLERIIPGHEPGIFDGTETASIF